MGEMRRVQKDDLPEQLWPMWDQLDAVAQDMGRQHHRMIRARWGCMMATGFCIGTGALNIALAVFRP